MLTSASKEWETSFLNKVELVYQYFFGKPTKSKTEQLILTSGLSLSSFLSLDCGLPSCPGDVIPLEGLGGGCVLALSLEFSELFVAVRLELPSRGGPGA